MQITIENICQGCEKGGCNEPCEKWYRLLSGAPVSPSEFGIINEEKDDDEN